MPEEIPKKQIEAINKLYWTPGDRATSVYSLLEDIRKHLKKENVRLGRDEEDDIPSEMDLLCFAVEFMGAQAIAIGDEEFLLISQHASRWLYSVHYSNPGRLWGEPDRKGEEDGALQESESEVRGSDRSRTGDGSVGGLGRDSQVQGDSEDTQDGDVPDDDAV